jgi:dual specificity tyrosine-phosphorylation-regulated kinase 2/3/4
VVYYLGKRRPVALGYSYNFDDEEGDLKVYAHDQIGYRYEVITIIGKGSFGQVFKAYDHKLKENVALKIIKNKPKYTTQAQV